MNIGWAGSSNTANASGYRVLTQNELIHAIDYARYIFGLSSIAVGGWSTFPSLVNIADLSAADLIIFDQSNDGADDLPEFEALIRVAQANGQKVIAILNPSWSSVADGQVNTPANQTAYEGQEAICIAYGLDYVDGWQMCQDHVSGGGHLSDYFTDTAHWSATGHAVVRDALLALLPTGGAITLPAEYVDADAADYENSPVIIVGTDNDATTGTWATDGTSVSSSDVGATITFSGTFRKFGIFNASANYPTCTATIDGGDPIADFAAYPNGYDIGTRGAHTVVLTVTSELEIDEFWAI